MQKEVIYEENIEYTPSEEPSQQEIQYNNNNYVSEQLKNWIDRLKASPTIWLQNHFREYFQLRHQELDAKHSTVYRGVSYDEAQQQTTKWASFDGSLELRARSLKGRFRPK